ncbi:hypothetical protein KC317_g21751, partial [Hortaea werneckii]
MPVSRADRLKQLRDLRAAGKTGFDSYEVAEAESIYETVDDEGYKKVVRSRLDQDDFVVDDNGEGYADDGREDWQDQRVEYEDSESEQDLPKQSKAAKRKREEDAQRQEKLNKGISKYFSANQGNTAPKPKPARTAEDDAFMTDLLGEVDTNIPSRAPSYGKAVRSNDRRKTRVLSPPLDDRPKKTKAPESAPEPENEMNSTPPAPVANDDDYYPAPQDDMMMSDPIPSSPAAKAVERREQATTIKKEDVDDDDLMEVAEVQGHANIRSANVNLKGSRPAPKLSKPTYPTP